MKLFKIIGLSLLSMIIATGCGNNSSKEESTSNEKEDSSFYQTQPVESGLYDASYYSISGKDEQKGHFDGRIYFSLSPELSAIYVFENGNRTPVDYIISLKAPFEKNDSVYASTDTKGNSVTIRTDSIYYLNFKKGDSNISVGFDSKPRHTGTALEILEKINMTKQKNSK